MSDPKPDELRRIEFFRGLSDEAFAAVSRNCPRRSFVAGELIIGHKDQSFEVLFLLTGQARVNIYSMSGRRISFRDIAQGAIFGELSAIDGEPRSASVECVQACTAAIMPRKAFHQALSEHPPFMEAVIKHLAGQVRTLTARVVEFSTLAVRNRVQAELLRRAGPVPHALNEAILSPAPTHAEIASRISTHREAVTRELSWLESKGLIAKEGRLLRLKDLDRLRMMAEFADD
jgi:CRP/FNR family transcriptional regulator, cyclic AMP receptor protein